MAEKGCGYADPPKLTNEERYKVCELVATFHDSRYIVDYAKKHWGKTILQHGLIDNYMNGKKWRPLIDRYRKEYMLNIEHTPIAHKRIRLDRLEGQYQRVTRNKELAFHARERLLTDISREARYEVEEAKSQFTNVYLTQIQNYSDEELLKRKAEIEARVASLAAPKHGGTKDEPVMDAEVTDVAQARHQEANGPRNPRPDLQDQRTSGRRRQTRDGSTGDGGTVGGAHGNP